jgi:hypothetical protein
MAATSKRVMSSGYLISWLGTSNQFSVQGKATDCKYCYCSTICSRGSIFFGCSRTNWPFKLLVTVVGAKNYHYQPISDFHISIDGLVRLVVEVQSDKHEDDLYRMLVQGACAARLGYNFYKRRFIVMALYIKKSGSVQRYFLFQSDDTCPTVHTFQSKHNAAFSQWFL